MPFFIIVAGVMIFLYGFTLYTRADMRELPVIVVFTIFMGIHASLHWLFRIFSRGRQSTLIYFYVQTILAVFIVYYAKELSLVFGLFLPLLGEEVGIFRRKREVLVSVLVNSILITAGFLFYFNTEDFDPLVFAGIVPLVFFVIIYVNLYNRQCDAKVKAEELLKELEMSRAKIEQMTIEQERQRMARELHDTLAQGLSGLILQLEAASVHLEKRNNEKAVIIIHDAMSKARETLAGVRDAIDCLRNDTVIDDDSALSGRTLSQFAESRSGRFEGQSMKFSCKVSDVPILDKSKLEHLKKIINETLTNCLIHSKAQNVNLELYSRAGNGVNTETELVLCISDDGIGFDPENISVGRYGIKGISERCGIIGAGFCIKSIPGGGTVLTVSLPCDGGLNG